LLLIELVVGFQRSLIFLCGGFVVSFGVPGAELAGIPPHRCLMFESQPTIHLGFFGVARGQQNAKLSLTFDVAAFLGPGHGGHHQAGNRQGFSDQHTVSLLRGC
jgi:hypothetical protein